MKKALLQAALLLSAGALCLQAQQDVRTGLISYWPMSTVSGTPLATPDLVSGYNMVLSTNMSAANFLAVTNVSTPGPDHGLPLNAQAVNVNGAQWLQYAGQIDGSTALPLSYSPSFSVLFWVKGASQSSGGADRIVSESYYVAGDTLPINSISANAGGFQLFNRIQGPANGATFTYNTGGTGLDTTWHHVAWVLSNLTQYVFIDDVPVSVSPTGAFVNGPNGYNLPNTVYSASASPLRRR